MTARRFVTVLATALFALVALSSAARAQAFSRDEKAAILATLNQPRADIDWSDSLPQLEWDSALEATAQSWARTCTAAPGGTGLLAHNPRRGDGFAGLIGENISGLWAPGSRKVKTTIATLVTLVKQWVDEASIYDYGTNTCAGEPYSINNDWKRCGHYTQIVSASTTRVGCGRSWCPNLPYASTLVCNFSPAANVYDLSTGMLKRP